MIDRLTPLFLLAALANGAAQAQTPPEAGKRPYELEWAHRTQDEFPPLIDFEKDLNWKVEGEGGTGALAPSRERLLWGASVGKLNYRATGDNLKLRVLLAEPAKLTAPFDTVTLWVYGNKFDYEKSANTSTVSIAALFDDSEGKEVEIPLKTVDWNEWFLLHRSLDAGLIARFARGAIFKGFTLSGGSNKDERALYLDNFAVFTDPHQPLHFEPRPKRNLIPFPGQTFGTNIGPGQLPFPTRPQTILPDNLAKNSKVTLSRQGAAFVWTYQGSDGRLTYRLDPKTGTLSDISLRWQPSASTISTATGIVRPCMNGGVFLAQDGKVVAPEQIKILRTELTKGVVSMVCELRAGAAAQKVTYRFSVIGKSLLIDTIAPGGQVAEVRYGHATGLSNPRLQTNPYYLYARGQRPAIVVAGPLEKPLFLSGNTDWYRSNGTQLWAENNDDPASVVYNGGSRYVPRTDGKRNDCFERFFITAAPRYEEVLPNIPNPKSPYLNVAGTHIWRTYGSGNRKSDAAYWEDIHRYGMTQVIVNNHETMWRDSQESFTFRTKPAPGKGGDQGEADFSSAMRNKLGFVYGPYNNYTDIAPINEYWNLDIATRTADNQFQQSWYRTYAPKPARAVEYAAKIPFILEKKFGYDTAYCDVHTAVAPWDRVDYDSRVPGAATFAGVYYAFGEILELQKAAWKGPVYSEGGYHAFYSGLTDGNYAQDPSADLPNKPWLVDFDLRKMHPLSANFGMGSPDMFDNSTWPADKGGRDARLDRFLAATIAFGHTGFLDYGTASSLRSYYMLQQLQSRYALSTATEIRYADAMGHLWDTSAAVAQGVFKRSQIVTRYANGTITAVNGNRTEPMAVVAYGRKLNLAPNGYAGWTPDGTISVLSNEVKGRRSDYAATPAYIYVDGRGQFTRYNRGAATGISICRILGPSRYEIIPFESSECGFAISAAKATALDKAGKTLGPAELRTSRGLTYVQPVAGAFSYILTGAAPAPTVLKCARDRVVAGEKVVVRGKANHTYQIPDTAKVGDRIWQKFEDQWIDFTVVAPLYSQIKLQGNQLKVILTGNLAVSTDLKVALTGEGSTSTMGARPAQTIHLDPTRPSVVVFDLGDPQQVGDTDLALTLGTGQSWTLKLSTTENTVTVVDFPEKGRPGVTLAGQGDSADFGTTGATVEQRTVTAGGVSKAATFMHPPWQNAIGVTFSRFNGLSLPATPAVFRAFVGKGDGSIPGNGLLYKVVVVDSSGHQTVVGETSVTEHEWKPIQADLTPWSGQTISLKLVTDPNGDTAGDWGAWAEMRITSRENHLQHQLVSAAQN